MIPRLGHVARFTPGPGLFGPVDRDGQLCRVLRRSPTEAGSVVVRWCDDAVTTVLLADLDSIETHEFTWGAGPEVACR